MNIDEKISRAVRLVRSYNNPVVAYSGGKDSDVLAWLFREAGVDAPLVHSVTTIDPPGTLAHCVSAGASLMRPTLPFFSLVRKKGWPTMWRRWCCALLKERYIARCVFTGIRRCESVRRAARYTEPTSCKKFSASLRTEYVMPLLYFDDADIAYLVNQVPIQCHPLYYESGAFDVQRRLGCIGCPLAGDRGRSDFLRYPKFFRLWVRAFMQYNKSHGYSDEAGYDNIVRLLFYSNHGEAKYESFYNGMFEKPCSKLLLSEYFNIEL